MSHPFYRTKLIYEVLRTISEHRNILLSDLVAYTQDPVRYKRRMRMLIQLASYELQILQKVKDEEITQSDTQELLLIIKEEIDAITNLYS